MTRRMSPDELLIRYPNCLDVPFEHILDWWDHKTKGGTDVEVIRALALWDRYFLLIHILGRKDALHPWLYERCREVEADPDGYLDLWAREHYKSTVITFAGIIQEVLRDPEITIAIFSHTAPIAKKFLQQIRTELEKNELLKQLFPNILWTKPSTEAPVWSLDNGIILKRQSNPKEATIEAHGLVDGQPTSKHYRLRVYDDVVVKESVSTPEQIAKTTEAWELSSNLGMEGGRTWYIGTRYSTDDTYQEIIKRGIVQVRLRTSTDDGTFNGKPVLWSEKENEKRKLEQGERTYSTQNLQNPLAGHLRTFDPDDLQTYEVRPETLNVYILCDPARSKKRDSANTAIAVIGVDYALNKYLLDGFNHKMNLQERWKNFLAMWVKWKRQPGVQLVRMGYEKFGAQADLDYFLEQQRLIGASFEIVELAWPSEGDGSKNDRIQRLGPDFRSHKFFLPYKTNDKSLTKRQRILDQQGYAYRIARPIRRADENQKVYDLGDHFRNQVTFHPFGLKDLVDAASRIYDMQVVAPTYREPSYAEPEIP